MVLKSTKLETLIEYWKIEVKFEPKEKMFNRNKMANTNLIIDFCCNSKKTTSIFRNSPPYPSKIKGIIMKESARQKVPFWVKAKWRLMRQVFRKLATRQTILNKSVCTTIQTSKTWDLLWKIRQLWQQQNLWLPVWWIGRSE